MLTSNNQFFPKWDFSRIFSLYIKLAERSSEAAMGGGALSALFLRINELKRPVRAANGRERGQNPL
jgi:hypothetical protein